MKKIIVYTCGFLFMLVSCTGNAQNPKQGGPKPNPDKIFKDLDTNKDGKISKAEAKGPLKKDFAKIDLNKDGYITKAELKKAPKPKGRKPPKK